jgi:ribosomal-protein-alanine N-acetyltransferase
MVVIRRALPTDAAVVLDIGVRAWTSHIFAFEPETSGMRARAVRAFEDFVEDHLDTVVVAEADRAVRGWGARENGDGTISDLWVDPDWQGRGIGSALLAALMQAIRDDGYERARLDTHARNVDALRFYERHGFRVVERRRERSTTLERPTDKVYLECRL